MFPRVPSRPGPQKGKKEYLPVDIEGNKIPYDGRGTENDLLLQIEVVKGLTPERRQRVRDMASVRAASRHWGPDELEAFLGRQFGLQRLQIKIILETNEDDIVDDTRLRKIANLDSAGRRIVHDDLQFKPQT